MQGIINTFFIVKDNLKEDLHMPKSNIPNNAPIIPHIDLGNFHNDYAAVDTVTPVVVRGIVIASGAESSSVLGTVYSDGSPAQDAIANQNTQGMLVTFRQKLADEEAKKLAAIAANQQTATATTTTATSAGPLSK